MIQAINEEAIHRLCSSQVVVDLATAVKELVENSLDAGATQIEVRLHNMGAGSFDVIDNGKGIAQSDYANIAEKHATSKLEAFEQLGDVQSFGFRGEALNSLCELSGRFYVVTKQSEDLVGSMLEFDNLGRLKKQTPTSRGIGTTVSVERLFAALPVRRSEFERTIKKHYQKMLRVLQAYAVICTNVRLSVYNTPVNNGPRQLVFSTNQSEKIEENISTLFGSKFLASLLSFAVSFDSSSAPVQPFAASTAPAATDEDPMEEALRDPNEDTQSDTVRAEVVGFVSRVGMGVGRSDNDRQFIYCNQRPIELPRLCRALNEVWRKYEMKQKPAFVVSIRVSMGGVDVNLSPDKREVVIQQEQALVESIRAHVDSLYEPSRSTFLVSPESVLTQSSLRAFATPVSVSSASSQPATPISAQMDRLATDQASPFAESELEHSTPGTMWATSHDPVGVAKSPFHRFLQPDLASPSVAEQTLRTFSNPTNSVSSDADSICARPPSGPRKQVELGDLMARFSAKRTQYIALPSIPHRAEAEDSPLEAAESRCDGAVGDGIASVQRHGSAPDVVEDRALYKESDESASLAQPQPAPSMPPQSEAAEFEREYRDVQWDPEACLAQAAELRKRRRALEPFAATKQGRVEEGGDCLQDERYRTLQKQDFPQMRILGQFNLGFIIAELRGDLYILDQHACDEKFRFEQLQRSTKIHQQPLLVPLAVDASAAQEAAIVDNMATFASQGFSLRFDPDDAPGKRVKLLAAPFSRTQSFGVDDVLELASMVTDGVGEQATEERTSKTYLTIKNGSSVSQGSQPAVLLPKLMAVFASRACRSAVMVGTALREAEMRQVVGQLKDVEQPWNCPHGRPTMRHLADVSQLLVADADDDWP